jgi:hypothetical protein
MEAKDLTTRGLPKNPVVTSVGTSSYSMGM